MESRVFALDIETTGLNPAKDLICEIGLVEVDMMYLTLRDQPFDAVLTGDGQIPHVRDRSNLVVREMHRKSGLTAAMAADTLRLTTLQAEANCLNWLRFMKRPLVGQQTVSDRPVLLGSSVHFDREFLSKQMPALSQMFHYRHIDVSSIKELTRNWYPNVYAKLPDFAKQQKHGPAHRAMIDILNTMDELRFYRSHTFAPRAWMENA
jgi:oligoribonuclease